MYHLKLQIVENDCGWKLNRLLLRGSRSEPAEGDREWSGAIGQERSALPSDQEETYPADGRPGWDGTRCLRYQIRFRAYVLRFFNGCVEVVGIDQNKKKIIFAHITIQISKY